MRRYAVVLALLMMAAPTPAVAAPAATIPTGRALAGLSQYGFTLLGLHADPAAELVHAVDGRRGWLRTARLGHGRVEVEPGVELLDGIELARRRHRQEI